MMRTRPGVCWMKLASVVAALCMAGALGGCNLGEGAFSALEGSRLRPAAYTLDSSATTVVFIDDPGNVLPSRSLRDIIGDRAERELLEHDCAKTVIQSRLLTAQTRRDDLTRPMTVAELGRSVDAKTVIHVLLVRFALTADGQSFTPLVQAWVRVIDVPTERVIYPAEKPWHDLVATMPAQLSTAPTNSAGVAQANRDLATFAGLSVAQLFYTHSANTNPQSLDEARKR